MVQHLRDIIVIGASAGGVQALQRLVSALPPDFPATVFIVLHMWPTARSYLAPILSRAGFLPAAEAINGETIERGRIYLATPDFHLCLEPGRIVVVRGPRENRARPAINPLFRSAAGAYGNRVIGVILTGTLDDGAAGLWAVKQCGGVAIVQSDPAFAEMPRSAVESVAVDFHLPLGEMPALLSRLVREPILVAPIAAVPAVVRLHDEGAQMKPAEHKIDHVGLRSFFSCPECSGALWELEEGVLQYRCHVGHAYSAESLKDAQHGTIEASLWSAVRALKESAALDQRLAERAAEHKLSGAANGYRGSASLKTEQVAQLQEFLASFRPERRVDEGPSIATAREQPGPGAR